MGRLLVISGAWPAGPGQTGERLRERAWGPGDDLHWLRLVCVGRQSELI